MLGKKNKIGAENTGNMLNIIGNGTTVTGDINSEGDLRVDGKINGHVNVKQRIVIGNDAVIAGDVESGNAIVSGKIKGNIVVNDTLLLKANCMIDGDIRTNKLVIESGAQFNGKCTMATTEMAHPTVGNGKQKPAAAE